MVVEAHEVCQTYEGFIVLLSVVAFILAGGIVVIFLAWLSRVFLGL